MANQYQVDPRQALFLKSYLDPNSPTFSNALQSALKAGYEQEYAENITHLEPDWLSEAIGTDQMIKKAERNLNKILDMDPEKEGKVDTGVLKVVADTSKFVTERLAKDKYSSKQVTEHSGTIEMKGDSELDKLAELLDKRNKDHYEE